MYLGTGLDIQPGRSKQGNDIPRQSRNQAVVKYQVSVRTSTLSTAFVVETFLALFPNSSLEPTSLYAAKISLDLSKLRAKNYRLQHWAWRRLFCFSSSNSSFLQILGTAVILTEDTTT